MIIFDILRDYLLLQVDYLICSEDFAKQYTNLEIDLDDNDSITTIFKKLKKLNDKQIVVTMGERGLLYEKDGVINHMKAFGYSKFISSLFAGQLNIVLFPLLKFEITALTEVS